MTAIKPMLAHGKTPDLTTLSYPQIVQPKYDGIRCMIVDGVALSRSAKPIRNAEIQAALGRPEFDGLDGELLVGSPCANDAMQRSSEFVMSSSKTGADWAFYVFDKFDVEGSYYQRRSVAYLVVLDHPDARFLMVPSFDCSDVKDVELCEERFVAEGYEGAILRDPRAAYKHGRSGKTGPLLKLKRWTDAEAVCIGVNEQMTNLNEATKDAFGRTERSTAKAGLVPAGTLGNLRCRTPEGVEFEVGTGFNEATRAAIWKAHKRWDAANPVDGVTPIIGRLVKYKFIPVGVKTAPRFPVFLGFRDQDDMS